MVNQKVKFFLRITILGYGIVNGALEKCGNFFKENKNLENTEDNDYESYKCNNLRGINFINLYL